MKFILLKVLFIVSVLSPCKAQSPDYKVWKAEDLCDNKVDRFTNFEQIDSMRSEYIEGYSCLKKINNLGYVFSIIVNNNDKRICQPENGERYKRLAGHEMSSLPGRHRFPSCLRAFMEDLAYEISAKCKLEMESNVNTMLSSMLNKREEDLMEKFERLDAMILSDSSVAPVASDLFQVWFRLDEMLENEKLHHSDMVTSGIPVSTMSMLYTVSRVCDLHFNVIQRQYTETLRVLASLGYDYSLAGELGEGKNAAFNSNRKLRTWLSMQLICKVLHGRDNLFQIVQRRVEYENDNKKLTSRHFDSQSPLPSKLMVDSRAQKSELKELARASSKEADQIVASIYQRVTGSKLSILGKLQSPNRNFAISLLKFIADKVGTRAPEVVLLMSAANLRPYYKTPPGVTGI